MFKIELVKFIVFDTSYGCEEGKAADKLLYYWHKDNAKRMIPEGQKIDDVCLCDASINMSFFFKTEETEKTINEKKNLILNFDSTQIFLQKLESYHSIWTAAYIHSDRKLDTSNAWGQNSIPSFAVEKIVKNIYSNFCLLNGPFSFIIQRLKKKSAYINLSKCEFDDKVRNKLRLLCEGYFTNMLNTIHLDSLIMNLATLNSNIVYLDLEALTLMKVNSYINHLVSLDAKQLRHTIVIFNDQLLWSSMSLVDTRILYNFLVSFVIREALHEELRGEVKKVRQILTNMKVYLRCDNIQERSNTECDNQTQKGVKKELDSTKNDGDDDKCEETKEYKDTDDIISKRKFKLTKLYMTVFRSSNNMTLALLLGKKDCQELIDKCASILTTDTRIGVIPMDSLAQSVGQAFLKVNSRLGSVSRSASPRIVSTVITPSGAYVKPLIKKSTNPDQAYICLDRIDGSITGSVSPNAAIQRKIEKTSLEANSIGSSKSQSSRAGIINSTSSGPTTSVELIGYMSELEGECRQFELDCENDQVIEEMFAQTDTNSRSPASTTASMLNLSSIQGNNNQIGYSSWISRIANKYRVLYSIERDNKGTTSLSELRQSLMNLKSIIG